jgi:hypothetical protein
MNSYFVQSNRPAPWNKGRLTAQRQIEGVAMPVQDPQTGHKLICGISTKRQMWSSERWLGF